MHTESFFFLRVGSADQFEKRCIVKKRPHTHIAQVAPRWALAVKKTRPTPISHVQDLHLE